VFGFFVASKCKLRSGWKSSEGAPTERTALFPFLGFICGGALTPLQHPKHFLEDLKHFLETFFIFGDYPYICLVLNS
jgi:hypothetical protein